MRKWFALAAVLVMAVALFASGAYEQLEPQRIKELVRAQGALGPVLFVLAFTFVQPLGPSGHLFVLASGLLWSGPVAFGLSLLGATSGQLAATLFYRHVAHDWAQRHIPPRVAGYQSQFEARPLRNVLLLRLLTFTWPVAPALLGVSRVPLSPMVLATVIGLAPGVAFDVWLGAQFLRRLLDHLW